jgi:Pyridoxamine 5'-phosphate oxidase
MDLQETKLDHGQCLALLASCGVGRLVYTADALPAVLPLRYSAVVGGVLVLHPAADPGLARAVDGAILAFEAGEVSRADGTGWSVTVVGRAEVVPAPGPVPGERATRTECGTGTEGATEAGCGAGAEPGAGMAPWPAGRTAIRLHPGLVTGRCWKAAEAAATGPELRLI